MTIEDRYVNRIQRDQIWEHLKWHPTNAQIHELTTLQYLLKKLNKEVNLTRLLDGNDFWVAQILDSLWPFKNELKSQSQSLKIIDVGTGCGLPGLAIAIALPNSSLTLVDSIKKKTNAVRELIEGLNLQSRVSVRTERIELTGQNMGFRYKFDFALARAVAQAPVLAEYLIPLLNPAGEAILYKGKWTKNDHQTLEQSLFLLQGKIKKVDSFQLPEQRGIRHAIRIKSVGSCPNRYPRDIGIPLKKPLNS